MDVAKAVQALVAAAPDAVVQISAYKSCAAFIREARKVGYGGTFYNVSFVGTQALADALGKEGAGVVVSQVMPSPYNAARAVAREFADAVKAAGKDAQVNFSSMEGYVAARVFAEGLKRAGAKPGREALITGLEALGNQSMGVCAPDFCINSSFIPAVLKHQQPSSGKCVVPLARANAHGVVGIVAA